MHKSHITIQLSELAVENNVSIICLVPNSTHVLQPFDVAVFKPAKAVWADIVDEHNKNKDYKVISKEEFPKLLRQLVENKKAFCRRHAVAGFESTGIYLRLIQMILTGHFW